MSSESAFMNAQSISSGGNSKRKISIRDPSRRDVDNLNIAATRKSTAYNVNIIWCDANFNELESEKVGNSVGGGTQHTSSTSVRSPYAKIEVADDGSSSGEVDLVAYYD